MCFVTTTFISIKTKLFLFNFLKKTSYALVSKRIRYGVEYKKNSSIIKNSSIYSINIMLQKATNYESRFKSQKPLTRTLGEIWGVPDNALRNYDYRLYLRSAETLGIRERLEAVLLQTKR